MRPPLPRPLPPRPVQPLLPDLCSTLPLRCPTVAGPPLCGVGCELRPDLREAGIVRVSRLSAGLSRAWGVPGVPLGEGLAHVPMWQAAAALAHLPGSTLDVWRFLRPVAELWQAPLPGPLPQGPLRAVSPAHREQV
ncbi:MAG: hypothetical protein Q8P67_10290 [archaeon]|nr:hypothetical protein [archaeon]